MKTMTNNEIETITFVKELGRWYPLLDSNTIDMRGRGFGSKKSVREWRAERSSSTGEKIVVRFR